MGFRKPWVFPFNCMLVDPNQEALEELAFVLETQAESQEFYLMLALCNSGSLRDRLVKRLAKVCDLHETLVEIPPQTLGLYGFLQEVVTPQTQALLVSGFDAVEDLDRLLTAANQIREEFRKTFHFPVVLWVSNEIHAQLQRLAPDLFSWASTTVFQLSTKELVDFVDRVTTEVFEFGLERGAVRPLDYVHSDLGLTAPKAKEVQAACAELRKRGVALNERSQAGVAFIDCLGHEPLSMESLRAYETCLQSWQAYYETQHPVSQPPADGDSTSADLSVRRAKRGIDVFANLDNAQVRERYAYVQYSLGVWWRNYAIYHPFYYDPACELAKDFFTESLALLQQSNRGDLQAKFINALGDIFERLEDWKNLAILAVEAIALHQQYPNPFRLARGYSFAAAAALGQKNYDEAIAFANQALELSAQTPPDSLIPQMQIPNLEWVRSYNRGYYHLLLAQAQLAQGKTLASLQNLELAKSETSAQFEPRLYLTVLQELHDAYFEQEDYLNAYHYKKQRRSVEQQFGFSAFVGAVQLRPSQSLSLEDTEDPTLHRLGGVAPEIRASGREADINNIRERLSRAEYKLTILYGPSGVGKSSLIRAGILPALHHQSIGTRDVLVVHSRLYTRWHEQFPQLLHAQLAEFEQDWGRSLTRTPDATTLATTLAQLRLNADTNQLMTVLVLDQFEEFFVTNKSVEERRQFYDFFAACLDIPYVKILISLREDYLFYLLELSRYRPLAAINHNILDKNILYYVGNFTTEQATDIITQLTAQAHFYIENALINELVRELASAQAEVRPVELQVVGEQLQAENITTLAQYREKGTKEWLVQRYLATVIADCGAANEAIAQSVLYALTDEDHTRPLKSRLELEQSIRRLADASTMPLAALGLVLDIFVEAGMVFLLPSAYGNQYQLVHDYLVPFIRKQQGEQLRANLRESERQRRQSEKRRQLSEARLNLLFRRTTIGSVAIAVILALMSIWLGRSLLAHRAARFEIVSNEIDALANSSEALFSSNHVFDALIVALQGGHKLQKNRGIPRELRNQVMSALQQSIFWVQEHNRLVGHQGNIYGVRFSAAGEQIISVSSDQTIRLWSPDGELRKTLKEHQGPVRALVVHPTDDTFITAGTDLNIHLWSADGTLQQTLSEPQDDSIEHLAIHPNGEQFAAGGLDGSVYLWSTEGQLLHHLNQPVNTQQTAEPITALAYSADGQTVVAGTQKGEILRWNLDGTLRDRWSAHDQTVKGVAMHPDGEQFVTISLDRTLKQWSAQGTLQRTQRFATGLVAVRYAPDGQTLAVSTMNKAIQLLNQQGTVMKTFTGHSAQVISLDFSPKGTWLASGGGDQMVRLWDVDYDLIEVIPHPQTSPETASFAANGESFAVGTRSGTVMLYRTSGEIVWTQALSDKPLSRVLINRQGTAMAIAGHEGRIWLWLTDTPNQFSPEPTLEIAAHERIVRAIAFSPDGQHLASASDDQTVKLWSLAGELTYTFWGHQEGIAAIAFHPTENYLASGSRKGEVQIWNEEGEILSTVDAHHGAISDVQFSPDGQWLATGSQDNTVKLWSAQGQLRHTFLGHADHITQLRFSPDSQQLASASLDQTVKLWNINKQRLITTLRGHEQGVRDLSFHPDHQRLLTVSHDHRLILWQLGLVGNLDLLLQHGCQWVSDYLQTNDQVSANQQYLCDDVSPVPVIADPDDQVL